MTDSASPSQQPAGSGGPPKPPKKTARGFDDASPMGSDIARRLLVEYSKRLADPDLSIADRTKIRKNIEELEKHIEEESET